MRVMAVSLFLIALTMAPLIAQPSEPPDIVQVARTAIDRMEQGDYAAVVATFNPRLRQKFPESELRKTWEGVHRRGGRLKGTAAPITKTKDNLRRVIVPAEFEKSKMEIEWVFNADGQIAGLLLHRK